ncbi:unnamed protein product [Prorocentrum cordatum]|uniref:Uncharacterized protein n=1 Tax=Prorocentrum cordatum TaxID=2364126 RepID=A0ABN9UPP2_9DINO|nr:unnamed protein product [Polarella glacialis]
MISPCWGISRRYERLTMRGTSASSTGADLIQGFDWHAFRAGRGDGPLDLSQYVPVRADADGEERKDGGDGGALPGEGGPRKAADGTIRRIAYSSDNAFARGSECRRDAGYPFALVKGGGSTTITVETPTGAVQCYAAVAESVDEDADARALPAAWRGNSRRRRFVEAVDLIMLHDKSDSPLQDEASIFWYLEVVARSGEGGQVQRHYKKRSSSTVEQIRQSIQPWGQEMG